MQLLARFLPHSQTFWKLYTRILVSCSVDFMDELVSSFINSVGICLILGLYVHKTSGFVFIRDTRPNLTNLRSLFVKESHFSGV